MKKTGVFTIILSIFFGFVLVECVLAVSSQTERRVAYAYPSVTKNQLNTSNKDSTLFAYTTIKSHSKSLKRNSQGLTQSTVIDVSTKTLDEQLFNRSRTFPQSPKDIRLTNLKSNPRGDNQLLASLQIQVNYGHDWVAGTTDPYATVVVTVTDELGGLKADAVVTADETGDFSTSCEDWFSGQCPDIQPDDGVWVYASGLLNEVYPVGTINGVPDAELDVVTGTLNAAYFPGSLDVSCEVWEEFGPVINTTADTGGGIFTCNFSGIWDLQPGDTVAVTYFEPDGDRVINILTWPWMRVNYAHDWIGANYPAGHTIAYTVTDDLGGVKATGSAQTKIGAGWGGDGFESGYWIPERPDIQPGDYAYFSFDDGYTTTLEVGEITGTLDVAGDIVSGQVFASGFGVTLTVDCHPWGAWNAGIGDAPVKTSWAEPDGSVPFSCAWDPNTEWDIQPGQDVGVMYIEPDEDRVINVFREPAAYLGISKNADGQPAADGNYQFSIEYWNRGDAQAENVVITDTMVGFSYLGDTSGSGHTGSGPGPIVWDLGTLDPGTQGHFDLFVAVTADESDAVTNTVYISSSSYDQGEPWERQSSWSGQIEPNNTHLGVNKGAWTGDPAPDNDFIFSVDICNHGNTASTEVLLTEQLPPTMELVHWWSDQSGWSEVTSGPQYLEATIPTIQGGSCSEVLLRVYLPPVIETGTTLTNTAWITANNDLETNDNKAYWEGTANEPHTNIGINKGWAGGQLVPGGELNYNINYYNSGNVPVGPFYITDTFPTSTTFLSAWHHDPFGGYPVEPFALTDSYAVWEFSDLENGFSGDFTIQLISDPGLPPGTLLENEVEISNLPGEDTYSDNHATWIEQLQPTGPNLRIRKWSRWNEDWQLNYKVAFENIGDETVSNFWITDTLDLATTWDNNWHMEFDESRLLDFQHTDGTLRWNFSEINPGEMGWLNFNANLNEPGIPVRWFTNTVQITSPPGETNPADNGDEDVAFSGGEIRRVELWLNKFGSSNMWGEAIPGLVITVTTPNTQVVAFADPGCGGCWQIDDAGTINPGDVVEVVAGQGLQPVTIGIPNPLDAGVDTVLDEVYGQIGGWFSQPVEVHGDWENGFQEVASDGSGNFLAIYDDIPTGANGYIRFMDEIDYAEVIFHRPFWSLDLVLDINYGHDWIEGVYEPGHTLWITVTESDSSTVKGLAELTTGYVPWWGGRSGFSTDWNGWEGNRPDIVAGDWVFGRMDNGFSNAVQVGDIDFEVDYGADYVLGNLYANWITAPLIPLHCEILDQPGNPSIDDMVDPDGGLIDCDFGGVWDIQPEHTVLVMYQEPDGDRVMNTANWPHMVANIGPLSQGNRHVWGDRVEPGATVALTVTTELGAFVGSTVLQADANGYFDSGDNLPEDSLGLWNVIWADFGNGITDTLQIYPMGADANPATDVVTVTAAGPPSFRAGLEYCRFGNCDWIDLGEIGESGIITVDLMAERGFDIQFGDSFHAHLTVWNGHELIYSWGLPAPELGVWKWNAGNHARPGGVVVYGVNIRNDGSGQAENVQIVDILPDFTSYADDTSGYPVIIGPGNVITWDLGTVESGQNMDYFVTLNVYSSTSEGLGVIDPNCATISTISEGDWDLENNQGCSGPIDVWEDDVDLGVSKSAEPADPLPGEEFDYFIHWCNNQGAAAGPVVLTDTMPASASLLGWTESQPWMHFWTEISFDGSELVLYSPGLPGNSCETIQLRVSLDPDVPISTTLENLVVIAVAEDVNMDNNWYLDTSVHAGSPRYDLAIQKGMMNGILVSGGYLNYWIDYSNNSNLATTVRVTDTLPAGISYHSAWWGDSGEPLPEPSVNGNMLTWDLGDLEVNGQRNFNLRVLIDQGVDPGTELENCVEIKGDGSDAYPANNNNCYSVTINPPGPNLKVEKWHEWHGDGQLGYTVQFANLGEQSISDVWISDTLPLDTHWNGWWEMDFDQSRLVDFQHADGSLLWNFNEINPGENGWLHFNTDLDEPGVPIRWFTNTVEISSPPGDTNPADNYDEDVAFSGGEVRRVHVWLPSFGNSSVWGEAVPGSVITVTTAHAVYNAWADPGCGGCWGIEDTGLIEPGDNLVVVAGEGLQPVNIEVPDPFDANASSITDWVWGQIDHLDGVWIEIELNGGSTIPTQTDSNGYFDVEFPDIPRGGEGEVRYPTLVDYTEVIFHRHWRSPDLFLNVNYAHDWVQGAYEAGHTLWITVTESDTSTIKGTAELTSGMIPGWGTSGFSTDWDGWTGDRPDIIPGDWVFGLVDNGFTSEVRVGTINGDLDVETDLISGTLDLFWYVNIEDFMEVECYPWGAWELGIDVDVKYSNASPNGDIPYLCEWDPATEWDIQPGQNVGVAYLEPDGDRVINAFLEYLVIYLPLVIR